MKRLFLLLPVLTLAGCNSLAPTVTKAEYDQISTGMSYSQVSATIGAPGEEMSSNQMPGIPGVMEPISTVMYMWQNSDGSNMNAMFQNDKMIQKAQAGLP